MDVTTSVDLTNVLITVLAGVAAGFLNVVAGGGSLITVPLLITTLDLPSAVANATNRVAIVGQNIFAVAGFKSKGVSTFPYNLYLGISAMLGAILGAKIAVDLDDRLFNRILSIIMILVVIFILSKPLSGSGESKEKMDPKHQIIGIISFFGVGVYGGFIQVGVGFIMIALLTSINGLSLVKTNSAKVFVALVYTSVALSIFILEDMINWAVGLTLALGNAIGGWIGSRWSVALGDQWIRRILVVAVVLLALKLWFYDN